MKLPVKVAPAWISITSPGWAAWRAAWRSPPALTAMSLPRVGGEYVVSRKTRGNSGSVWARARVSSRGIVCTHAKTKARQARRAGEPVPENMVVSVPDINPESFLPAPAPPHPPAFLRRWHPPNIGDGQGVQRESRVESQDKS